ncbi:transcriptional Coactivator p15 [Colletotrichum karsti]|uniref:Transcriptional Coactivator p15 n=1 Tax=Colletotrichum karsti TaxID=1095194 RepID=A0A9P6LMX9_9PEZI|nr:transcriptional Coactivator p15 [Colletotrichum karsti]KAF9881969.1 transcriptional Coactivator p15 [Colletotrichum karsti]
MPFTKGTKRSAKREAESEEDEVVTKPTKKTKTSKSADGDKDGVDKDGNPFWDLSNKRRVGISEFNKSTFVNIREYYEKDGNMLPGKKGISLSIAQYETLLKAVPAINAKLREMGHEVKEVQQGNGSPVAEETSKPAAKDDKSKKANIEATSDEDSE